MTLDRAIKLCKNIAESNHKLPCDDCKNTHKILAELLERQKWIDVEDKLPKLEEASTKVSVHHRPKSIRVLCVCKQRSGKVLVKEGYYELWSGKPCWRIPGSIDSVTHWMPLPEPPECQ